MDEKGPFALQLLAHGWTTEPAAKLFVQVNHSEVLDEFVRGVGASTGATEAGGLPDAR